jgi:hypothetical protein
VWNEGASVPRLRLLRLRLRLRRNGGKVSLRRRLLKVKAKSARRCNADVL